MCLHTFQQGWAATLGPQLPGISDMIDSWTCNLLSMPPPTQILLPGDACSSLLTFAYFWLQIHSSAP